MGGASLIVVWLPSSSDSVAQIWNGLSGVQEGNERAFARRRSGYILLTSADNIGDNPVAAASVAGWPLARVTGIPLVAMAICIAGFVSWWRFCVNKKSSDKQIAHRDAIDVVGS